MEDESRKIEFKQDNSLSKIILNYMHSSNSIIKTTNVPENTDLGIVSYNSCLLFSH